MKFNVKPSDCQFVVNKEKKTVVCIYEECRLDFIYFINDNCKMNPFISRDPWAESLYEKMIMPNRFIGVAICGPNDEWNEKTGRLIAFSRMKDKLNKSFFKRANTFFNTVDEWLNETVDLLNVIGDKLEVNQERRHAHIQELVGEKKEDA